MTNMTPLTRHVDVCQRHLSRLVTANDNGWSESLLSCLHAFITCFFDVLGFFTIKLPSLLVQCNACQVDTGFGKGVFFLHVRISVWIDLGGGAPVIDLSGSWAAPPANVFFPDLATEPFQKTINYP